MNLSVKMAFNSLEGFLKSTFWGQIVIINFGSRRLFDFFAAMF